MVVRMRSTRSHTGNRRSHHALEAQAFVTCECGAKRLSHHACSVCGRYRGRVVVDLAAKAQARAQKLAAKREKEGRAVGDKNEGQK
ncbi:50S ribosomal protein L32 [Candidatus Adlerbacteria bacterium RIFCSPLOWO2_01_FULL_51_16]|uniref:Large ribosomal subunit protein bL32 n=1 Tax=Candidatus Adlerbacteria bacterium RIFCSPLOWO2_01_FULL_51_16 TaxID=1797243 RepID=A0A1F4XFF6_9BACT|nr:MAG: 50S ribosomal protein L32 [Candidatus Adlerbacteria bacterium RIFCSPLOWO2_01_FULL_51_16]